MLTFVLVARTWWSGNCWCPGHKDTTAKQQSLYASSPRTHSRGKKKKPFPHKNVLRKAERMIIHFTQSRPLSTQLLNIIAVKCEDMRQNIFLKKDMRQKKSMFKLWVKLVTRLNFSLETNSFYGKMHSIFQTHLCLNFYNTNDSYSGGSHSPRENAP